MDKIKVLEQIFKTFNQKFQNEMSALLAQKVLVIDGVVARANREELFKSLSTEQVVTGISLVGPPVGSCIVITDMRGALTMGGSLIMLPEDEIAERVQRNKLGDDEADAYGEIVNICCGVLSKLFQELYPVKIRFVKGQVSCLDPREVVTSDEYPLDPGEIWISKATLSFNGKQRVGQFIFAVHADALGLDATEQAASTRAPASNVDLLFDEKAKTDSRPHVLVFSDSEKTATEIIKALQPLDIDFEVFGLQTDARESITKGGVRGVLLVMEDVQEQGIAVAIKLRSLVNPKFPLIAAGPNWTKSMVLRAIKYGVHDILVTPASESEIQNRVRASILH